MKKILSLLVLILFACPIFAQEDEETPVFNTFEAGQLIDNQTVMTPMKGSKEFLIHHRMGYLSDGLSSLYGFYSPSNIRLGMNYGVTDRLMLGFGTEKDAKFQEFQAKYALLRQTESGSMPFSVTLYGNADLDARDKELGVFGPDTSFRFIHRISYFTQVIIARKFCDAFSFQVAPTFMYFNSVERGYKNFNYGLHAGGKITFSWSNAIIFEYDQLFTQQEDDANMPKPQLALGYEKTTGTHTFQVFMANYKGIIGQRNFLYNQNSFTDGLNGLLVGFNITIRL